MPDFVANDTNSRLRVTCIDRETSAALNLTNCTVKLQWNVKGTDYSRTMSVVGDPLNGVAEYLFEEGELVDPSMDFEVEIYNLSGRRVTGLNRIHVVVRAQIQ